MMSIFCENYSSQNQPPSRYSVPDNEDEVEALKDTPACTIVVHGVSGISNLDILEMYFESKKRSGGDEISSIKKDGMDSDVLYITYDNQEVAQAVVARTHCVNGETLNVSLYMPQLTPQEPVGPRRTIRIHMDIPLALDILEMYFESQKRSGGGKIESVDIDPDDPHTAYVTFMEQDVAHAVASRSHCVNGETLKVSLYTPQTTPQEPVGPRRTISIHMDKPLAIDILEMYFESQKRSGGGEIESVDIEPDDPHTAYVTFMEQDVLTSVLERGQHRVNGQILQVELYIHEPLSKTDIKQKNNTEQKQSQDKEEKEPSSTVKVTGISKEVSLDTVVYFFENKHRSGGGEILKYWQGDDNLDTCFITYVNAKDAHAVSEKSPHNVSGQEIRATLYRPLPTYTDRALIKGLSSATTQDCLFNYLEAKVQAVPVKMVHGTEEGVVLVTFKEDPDFAKLETISGKPLEGSTLTLSPVPVSNCIYVSNIGKNTSRDTLLYYFENTRQSGGGVVEKVVMRCEENAAVVYFKEYHTTFGVLSKQEHKVDGQQLAVEIYLELLGCTKKRESSKPELKIPKPVTITRLNVQKLRFIQATPVHKQSLEQLMIECHGHIQWHVKKQEVKIECTLTSEVKDSRKLIIDWEKTVGKCFQDFFETIIVKDIPVSASTMNDVIDKIRDTTLSTSESVSMMIDKEHCLFRVVGIGPNVVEAAEKVQATIKSVNKEKTDKVKQSVTTLKPIQTKMLVSNKFPVKCKERFPNLKVVIKQYRNEIMFEGTKTDVTEGKFHMHETVNTFATAKLPDIPKDFAHLYNEKQVREHIIRKLKSQNLVAVWEMSLQTNVLSICAPNDDTLDECIKTIRNTLVEKQVQLTKENRYVVQTQNWIDQVQHWKLQFSGRVLIRVDDLDTVIVCTTDDIIEQLAVAVEDFIIVKKIEQDKTEGKGACSTRTPFGSKKTHNDQTLNSKIKNDDQTDEDNKHNDYYLDEKKMKEGNKVKRKQGAAEDNVCGPSEGKDRMSFGEAAKGYAGHRCVVATLPDKCKPPPSPEKNTPPPLPEKSGQKRTPFLAAETEKPVVSPKGKNAKRIRVLRIAERDEGNLTKDEELQVQVVISLTEDDGNSIEYQEDCSVDVEEYLKVQFITRTANYDMLKSERQEDVRMSKNRMLKIKLGKIASDTDCKELARKILKSWLSKYTNLLFNSMAVSPHCPKHLMEKLLEVDTIKKQVFFYYTENNNYLNYVCKDSEQNICCNAIFNIVRTFSSNCKCSEEMSESTLPVQNQNVHGDVTEGPTIKPSETQKHRTGDEASQDTLERLLPSAKEQQVVNDKLIKYPTAVYVQKTIQEQMVDEGSTKDTPENVSRSVTLNQMDNEEPDGNKQGYATQPVTQNQMDNVESDESTQCYATQPVTQKQVNIVDPHGSISECVTKPLTQELGEKDEDQAMFCSVQPERQKLRQKEKHNEVTVNVEVRSVFQQVFEDLNNEVHFQNTVESFTFQDTMIRCTLELERDMLICHVTGTQHIVDETVNWLYNYVKGYFYETVDFADIQYAERMGEGRLGSLVEEFLETLNQEDETDWYWFVNEKAKIVSICSTDKEQAQTLIEKVKQCFVLESVCFENEEDLHCVARDLHEGRLKGYETEIALIEKGNKIMAVGFKRHVDQIISDLKSFKVAHMTRRIKVSEADPSRKPVPTKVKRPVHIKVLCQKERDFLKGRVASKFEIDIKEHRTQEKILFVLEGPPDVVAQAAEFLSKLVCQKVEVIAEDKAKLSEVIARMQGVETKVLSDEPYKEVNWTLGAGHLLKLSVCQDSDCLEELLVERTVLSTGEGSQLGIRNTSGGKKMIQLLVPCIEGKLALEIEKHTLEDRFKDIIDEAIAHKCTHLSVSLDPFGGWIPDKFLEAIFPAIKALEDKSCPPLTVQTCVRESAVFSKCQNVISEAFGREPENSTSCSPSINVTDGLCIEIIQGELSKAKVDVLVNSTSKDLQLDSGAVSRSLLWGAGRAMQGEVQRKYPRGIQFGEVAQTHGYKLPCKEVFHCVLDAYGRTLSVKPIADIVDRCLEMADKDGFTSIAFPALGTGNLDYPKDKTAAAMLDSIRRFEGSSLKDVKIVIYPADKDTFQKFSDKMKTTAGTTKGENPKQGKASPRIQTPDIVFGRLRLHARVGSVTGVTADSLIYVWEKDRMFSAKFKDHKLLKEIEKEYHIFIRHRDNKELRYKILITKGGNLRVHNIIHIPCEWSDLQSALTQGLKSPEVGKSTVIFFESTHPFLKHGDKLGDVICQTASRLSPSLQCLQKLEVLVEDKISAKKVLEYFKSNFQPLNVVHGNMKTFTVMLCGLKDDVEKAKHALESIEPRRT